jgi:hypothetical protein
VDESEEEIDEVEVERNEEIENERMDRLNLASMTVGVMMKCLDNKRKQKKRRRGKEKMK